MGSGRAGARALERGELPDGLSPQVLPPGSVVSQVFPASKRSAFAESGGGNTSPPLPPPNHDVNGDGILDPWRQVVATTDPCADNFDEYDLLGAKWGGPSTARYRHPGVDVQGNSGDPVYSFATGSVLAVDNGWEGPKDKPRNSPEYREAAKEDPCGIGVDIHATIAGVEYFIRYCHFLEGSIAVQQGQAVGPNTVLGAVGETGRTTGPHAHISVIRRSDEQRLQYFTLTNTQPIDPDHFKKRAQGGC